VWSLISRRKGTRGGGGGGGVRGWGGGGVDRSERSGGKVKRELRTLQGRIGCGKNETCRA